MSEMETFESTGIKEEEKVTEGTVSPKRSASDAFGEGDNNATNEKMKRANVNHGDKETSAEGENQIKAPQDVGFDRFFRLFKYLQDELLDVVVIKCREIAQQVQSSKNSTQRQSFNGDDDESGQESSSDDGGGGRGRNYHRSRGGPTRVRQGNGVMVHRADTGELVGNFISVSACSREMRINIGKITSCCTKQRPHANGYVFSYITAPDQPFQSCRGPSPSVNARKSSSLSRSSSSATSLDEAGASSSGDGGDNENSASSKARKSKSNSGHNAGNTSKATSGGQSSSTKSKTSNAAVEEETWACMKCNHINPESAINCNSCGF